MELQIIQNKISTIRGLQVMLDVDLAVLYGVETKVLNQVVKRNIEKFPNSFRFQLTENEYNDCSRSQIVTLNNHSENLKIKRWQNTKISSLCIYRAWCFNAFGSITE